MILQKALSLTEAKILYCKYILVFGKRQNTGSRNGNFKSSKYINITIEVHNISIYLMNKHCLAGTVN